MFLEFWRQGLLAYDELKGLEWEWLAMDGRSARPRWAASGPARIPPTELKRGEAEPPHRGQGRPARARAGGGQPARLEARPSDDRVDPDRAAQADAGAAARAVPGQGLRLPRGVRARRASSASPPTSAAAARKPSAQARGRLPARRWVVERTHCWLNRFRRLLIRWEKRADTYLAMLHLACGLITWRATNWDPYRNA